MAFRLRSLLLLALASGPAFAAGAESLVLHTVHRPGDRYDLALETGNHSRISSRAPGHPTLGGDGRLTYEAAVDVLAVDDAGRPVRELHRDVTLTFVGPERRGSLFGEGTVFEVRQADDGIRIFSFGRRADSRVEAIVGELLETRREHRAALALVDPGRPVEPGESWPLDPARARAYLAARGLKVLRFDGSPTATFRHEGGTRRLDYRLSVGWLELEEMPPNARTGRSHGLLEGSIQLPDPAGAARLTHASELTYGLSGATVTRGWLAAPLPWRVEASRSLRLRTRPVDQLASAR